MKIKPMGKFLRTILLGWVRGICIAPFGIYIDDLPYLRWRSLDGEIPIIEHELIHWQQQTEMLYLFFYLWYFIEWLIRIPKYKGQAYANISFEREAYDWPNIKNRKRFNWINYL